jgi:hypothetical protein
LQGLDLNVLACVCLALFLFHPLLADGLPRTGDGILHFYRSALWQWSLDEGTPWPRWHTFLYRGYGYPMMNFNPPLLYYLTIAFNQVTGNLILAYKAVLFAACLSYVLGMYVWSRDVLGKTAALVAATAYGFATFRFRELYYQGNYPQFLAWSLYPWIFFFFRRLAVAPTRTSFLAALLSYAALLLSHNISVMLFSPFLGLYVLWHAIANRRNRFWYAPFVAMVGAIALAAVYLLPALAETGYTRVSVLTEGYFDVAEHFISEEAFFAGTPRLDYRAANPVMPYNFGRLHLALALVGALALARRSLALSTRLHILFALLAVPLLAFMMLPPSLVVWRGVPGIAFAEFPTRMYGPSFLFSSFLVGASMLWLRPYRRLRFVAAAAIIVALIVAVAPYQFPRHFFPVEVSLQGVMDFEENHAVGTTSANEFLSIWTPEPPETRAVSRRLERSVLVEPPPGVEAEVVEATAHTLQMRVQAANPAELSIAQFYFPGWRAWVDGEPAAIEPEEGTGFIRMALPAGEHEVVLRFTDTPVRRAASFVTIGTLLALLALLLLVPRRLASASRDGTTRARPSYSPVYLSLLILVLGALKVWVGPRTSWFTFTSPEGRALPAEHSTRLMVGPDIALIGYDMDETDPQQGEELFIRLYWQALHPIPDDYSVAVHLIAGPDRLIFAQSDVQHPGYVPTSTWNPSQYIVDEHHIHIPEGVPTLTVIPYVGLYNPEADALAGTVELPAPVTIHSDGTAPTPARLLAPSGAEIALLGYKARRGEEGIELTFYWQANGEIGTDYQVFLHLLDAEGEVITQADSPPVQGVFPTSLWEPGRLIGDVHSVTLPPGSLPAAIRVGLYDLATLQRLPGFGVDGQPLPDNAVTIPLGKVAP